MTAQSTVGTDTYVVAFTDISQDGNRTPLVCDYEVPGRDGVVNAMGMIVRDYQAVAQEDGPMTTENISAHLAETEQMLVAMSAGAHHLPASATETLEFRVQDLKRTLTILDFLERAVVSNIGDLKADTTVDSPVMVSLLSEDVEPTLHNVLVSFLFRLESQGYRFDITKAFQTV